MSETISKVTEDHVLEFKWSKQYFYCYRAFSIIYFPTYFPPLWHEVDYDDKTLCYLDNLWRLVSPHLG